MTTTDTDTYFLAGTLVRFLERNPQAGYCLVEAIVAPEAGPPSNRHSGDDEAFYVLEGNFEFGVDAETIAAKAGDFVRVPLGAAHTFRNVGTEPGRLLILNVPGTMHVNFFSEAGEPVPSGTQTLPSPLPPPDIPRMMAAAARVGMEFLPPPGH
jgi:mannose-6-phosphate isomerase-like protein (cupin superfamily)